MPLWVEDVKLNAALSWLSNGYALYPSRRRRELKARRFEVPSTSYVEAGCAPLLWVVADVVSTGVPEESLALSLTGASEGGDGIEWPWAATVV